MGLLRREIGGALILLSILIGSSWAGTWDFNPGQEGVTYTNDVTTDVTGTGYVMEYTKSNTNNLSMIEYTHGSGNMDFAEILNSNQKTPAFSKNPNLYIYYIDYYTGRWTAKYPGASSTLSYTRQYDNAQSPTSFAFGTGWYATHPVVYNSLLKDKNQAKTYQESASMQRQIEYARAVKGDIAVDMNCSPPTATVAGTGSISMKLDEKVSQGMLDIGELLAHPMSNCYTPKYKLKHGVKHPIIDIETGYVGDFEVQKTMKLNIKKGPPLWAEDWLPCCSGGFFDIPSYNFDRERGSQKGIFDCTCRQTSISTMQPVWNTTMAQFPATTYRYKP